LRFRGSLILFIILLVTGAFYYLYFLPMQERLRREEELRRHLFNIPPDEVDYIKLLVNGLEYELRKTDEGWFIMRPEELRADDVIIRKTIEKLNSGEIKKLITLDVSRLEEFGLKRPIIYALLGYRGNIAEFFFGRPSPTEEDVYVYRRGTDGIFLVSRDIADALSHDLYSLRRKEPFFFDPKRVKEIRIVRQSDIIDMRRAGNVWWMDSPLKGRCSSREVARLLEEISTVRAIEFVDHKKPDPSRFPRSASILLIGQGDNPVQIDLYYWGTTEDTGIVVYQHGLDYYARVDRDFWNEIHRDVARFRYRNLFDMSLEEIRRLEFTDKEGTLIIERRGGQWYYGPSRPDRVLVEDLLRRLLEMEAYRFTSKKDLEMGHPRMSVILSASGGKVQRLDVYDEVDTGKVGFAEGNEVKTFYAVASNLDEPVIVTDLQIGDIKGWLTKVVGR